MPGPLSVFCARMPLAFTRFYGKVSKLDKKLTLPADTALLIRQQVARSNVCSYCVDANRYAAIKKSAAKRGQVRRARQLPRELPVHRRGAYGARLRHRGRPAQGSPDRDVRRSRTPLQRAGDLRDRLAPRQRTPLQHQHRRTQHQLRRVLRGSRGGRRLTAPRCHIDPPRRVMGSPAGHR